MMSFEQQLDRTVGRAAAATRHGQDDGDVAAPTVALHAPHVLRRFAEIAAVFVAHGIPSAQGAITARHDDRHGYHEVEYDAPDLHIRFGLVDGAAHLHWRTASAVKDRIITAEAGRAAIDDALLDAVSAFVGPQAGVGGSGTNQPS